MTHSAPSVRAPRTQRQSEILDFIVQFIDTHHYSPSFRELCHRFPMSLNGMRGHLLALQRKGYVEFERYRYRTLRPTANADSDPSDLAVLATVAWGCLHGSVHDFDDVADRLGCDPIAISSQLERLRAQGFLTWDRRRNGKCEVRLLSPDEFRVSEDPEMRK